MLVGYARVSTQEQDLRSRSSMPCGRPVATRSRKSSCRRGCSPGGAFEGSHGAAMIRSGPSAGSGRSRLRSTAVQQDRPSVTTSLPAARSRLASVAISFLRKPLTTVSRSRLGLRSAVVSTAATNGVLPAAPRPRLPPERWPAQVGVVDLDPALELGLFGLARLHRRHQLVLEQPGGRLPGAEPAASSTDDIPPLLWLRW